MSPGRFDLSEVDKVRIYGENLDSVNQVLLNGKTVEFLLTTTGVIVVNTTEFRDGEDTYDLIVASPSGKDSLNGAFELQAAQINLAITETRLTYDQTQNSLVVVRGPGMGEVDTVLINNKSVQFQIINAQELQAPYPFSDTTLSVEVRAKGQSAKSTVSP